MPRLKIPVQQRFWSKVDKNGPVPDHMPHLGNCWLWKACILKPSGNNKRGYGLFVPDKPLKMMGAHRFAWILSCNKIPAGLCVLHHCDVRNCVRIDHLFLGTQKDNALDRSSKGRNHDQRGELNHRNKLTAQDVSELRRLHIQEGVSYSRLARKFGITFGSVGKIIRRERWSHI